MSDQMRRASSAGRARAVIALALVAGVLAVPAIASAGQGGPNKPSVAASQSAGAAQPGIGTPADDRWRGLKWAGLKKAAATSRCRNGYEISGPTVRCTHGPDPAPAGVSALRFRSTNELRLATAAATAADQSTGGSATSSTGNGVVGCYDDGQSGDRVQVIYAHAANVADRYASLSSMFPQWAANADASFNDSAAQTGGVRHLRFLTDASCNLIVDDVQLSTTGADSFGNTMNEVRSLGYTRPDRKYLVWVDASVYCGISTILSDDQPGQANANNVGGSYARVDSGCWGQAMSAEAHELMHMLGGVQNSAPHATGGYHCSDENDRMCYQDGPGVVLTYPCAGQSDRYFDCGHDDYYNTNPAAGSYLATHWNSANNAFLAQADPVGFGTTTSTIASTTTTVAPTTSTTAPAATQAGMSSTTYTGAIARREVVTYPITAGAGTLSATLSCSTPGTSMVLTLTNSAGRRVANARGRTPVNMSKVVVAGSYNLVISSSVCDSYTLTVSYPTAS